MIMHLTVLATLQPAVDKKINSATCARQLNKPTKNYRSVTTF